jgi:hypothetical protein
MDRRNQAAEDEAFKLANARHRTDWLQRRAVYPRPLEIPLANERREYLGSCALPATYAVRPPRLCQACLQ